jgi:hypothetical protein
MSVNCKLTLYADDSALIFSHKDSNVIANRLSLELCNCKQWLIDNRLSLHVGKTECLLFGTSRKLGKIGDFHVKCDGESVKRVDSVTYLGVTLDKNMNSRDHAECLMKKCIGRVSFLYRKAQFLDLNCRKILCSSLVQPLLDYCCSSWYSSLTKQLKQKLDVLQRRMLRFVYSMGPMDHVGNCELSQLSWLSISDRVQFFKLVRVFKIRQGTSPGYLALNFKPVASSHSYETRGSSYDFFISKDIAQFPKGFAYSAIKHWNSLPIFLKEIESESLFKVKLKLFLSSQY